MLIRCKLVLELLFILITFLSCQEVEIFVLLWLLFLLILFPVKNRDISFRTEKFGGEEGPFSTLHTNLKATCICMKETTNIYGQVI